MYLGIQAYWRRFPWAGGTWRGYVHSANDLRYCDGFKRRGVARHPLDVSSSSRQFSAMPPKHNFGGRDRELQRSMPWADIDNYAFSHLHPASRSNFESLEHTLKVSKENGFPPMHAGPAYAKFLSLQCRAKHALEVGTLAGYSAIWLATQNPDLKISTIEYNPQHAKIARENLERAGVADRVTVYEGAGVDVLPRLHAEIKAGVLEPIGFAFIDADKPNNWTYFDWAVKMSRKGVCIIIDNQIRRGFLLIEEFQDEPHVAGGR